MAQKRYYTAEEAAEVLGVTPGEISQRRERRELHGLRDGATWKFKVEDIESLAEQLKSGQSMPTDEGDVLASEVELGPSASSKSGTVLPPGKPGADSDIKLGGSDIKLADSDVKLGGSDVRLADSDIKLADTDLTEPAGAPEVPGDAELDMTLDEDLKLDDSQISLADEEGAGAAAKPKKPAAKPKKPAGPAAAGGETAEDDEVLGGPGSGSDVTIGSDSGISLVDPKDSGLSLEEPLEITPSDDDSLELGEDDMLTFEGGDTESPTELKTDDDEFLLTPLEEAGDEDESDSGSQVIALDSAGAVSDTAATMVGSGQQPMAAMLDEDIGGGVPPLGAAAPAFDQAGAAFEQAPMGAVAQAPTEAVLPETPYSGWNVAALSVCILILVFCGWMSYDLIRNMWSWDGAYQVNSSLMDWVLGLFGK